ncbi:MAG: hypothetical protein ABII72_01630 [Parcubacteria group bacterium]
MTNKTKIIIIASIAVVVLAVAGWFVYTSLIKKPTADEIPEEAKVTPEEKVRLELTEEEVEKGTTLEEKIVKIEEDRRLALEEGEEIEPIEIDEATVKAVIEDDVMSTTLSPDGNNLYYYDPVRGELYMSDLDGSNQQAITSANFQNVYDLEWSPNKDKAVIAFSENDGEDKEYAIFDLKTQETVKYDKKFQAVTLSPDQSQIAYIYKDEENDISNISVADPYDTGNYQSLYHYSRSDIKLNWIGEKEVAIEIPSDEATGYEEGNIQTIVRTDDNSYRTVVGEQYGADSENGRSPDESKMIFNQSDVKNPRELGLYTMDSRGLSEPRYLEIDTLVSKCAWAKDNKTVYCGVPDFWPDNMVMPNDYREENFISTDAFYKINTETLAVDLIASSDYFGDTFDVHVTDKNSVSSDGKIFYFQNRVDKKTYALNIPQTMIEEKK